MKKNMNASRISNRKDIAGNKYGKLTAISFVKKQISGVKFNDKIPYTKYLWLFKCDCGNEKTINRNDVISGNVRSCGCLSIVHGYTRGGKAKPIYNIWRNLKAKCSNSNHYSYAEYGGRGVKVCERWLKFENFLADMGERPEIGCRLDRIDGDGDYELSNCRWSTRSE